jgi:hypothetical protein
MSNNIMLSRRQLRHVLFAVSHQRVENLDRKEKEWAEQVQNIFHGYLLGSIGWTDFSFKWDINPGPVEEDGTWSRRKQSIHNWTEEIINLWEWKDWLRNFKKLYGKDKVPPPCFTRQEKVGQNGG